MKNKWATILSTNGSQVEIGKNAITISSNENADILVETGYSLNAKIFFIGSYIVLISRVPLPVSIGGSYRERRFLISSEKLEVFVEGEALTFTRRKNESKRKDFNQPIIAVLAAVVLSISLILPNKTTRQPRTSGTITGKIRPLHSNHSRCKSKSPESTPIDYWKLQEILTTPRANSRTMLAEVENILRIKQKLLMVRGNEIEAKRIGATRASLKVISRWKLDGNR